MLAVCLIGNIFCLDVHHCIVQIFEPKRIAAIGMSIIIISGVFVLFNPFTAMMSHEKQPIKLLNLRRLNILSSFSHWHVKGFSSKRIAPKVDVI